MKKIAFLGCVFVGTAVFAADDVSVNGAEAFNGAYVGAGVAFGHIENKASVTWNSFRADCPEILNKKKDFFGVSAALGYGRVFSNNLYAGGEFLVDIFENKSFSGTYYWRGNVPYSGKIRGIIPSVALRLGYYVDSVDTLVYVRGGAAYVKSDFYDGFVEAPRAVNPNVRWYGERHDMSKITPIIGLGIEKKFGLFGARLEGDYRFNTNRNFTEGVRAPGNREFIVKGRNRLNGYTIRLMVTCSFR